MAINNSAQKFIARNRAPRVQIEYDVEIYGSEKKIELPFVMAVLADLAGKPREELPPVTDRKFLDIDIDNFNERMKAIAPRVAFAVPNTLTGEGQLMVDITLENMDDFSPAQIARKVDALNQLLEARTQLANLQTYMDGKAGAENLVNKLLQDPTLLKTLANTITVSDDAYKSISAIIAQIDFKLTEQIKLILQHPDWQKLESSWRGMEHLVYNTETDEKLKIRFMNLSKDELRRNMKRYKGIAWDQSPMFKKLYEAEYGQLGGEPYGCIIADYYFDHTPPDVDLLGSIAKVAASAHAPFIAGASPSVLQMDSWQELANPRDLTKIVTQNLEYAPWNSLRASEDSRYIGLTMPRFLARLPYGAKTNPVDEFDFEEDADGSDHTKYVWSNAAYAMGVNINRSFKHYGWCTLIRGVESGGAVENLPCHTFPTDDGGVDMKCPTEIAISDRREAELAKNGFIPLIHRKNSDYAAFIGAQSLQKPQEYYDPDATANANLSARLPYLFACSRFAHFLKCIVRDKIGSFKEREDMQRWLNEWIMNYVDADPVNSSQETKARRPLAAAEVVVEEVEGNPGYYDAKFFLRPHFQLEGLTGSLRLVTKLPSVKQGNA
ncbi:TPA: type VI secretion system contractile sheath large subunit [Salmonella enterica]|nr:type VI secretion system contractile sheath large subunit [Salmonella enterica]EBQ7460429.1 type VI secretion system contractile sheath large subunit [Salmonella enterica]HAK0243015.1 type VI secretion system contractile sheath large subunit [Salmonella enterica]